MKKHAEIIEKNGIKLGIEHQDLIFSKNLKELGNNFFSIKNKYQRMTCLDTCGKSHAHMRIQQNNLEDKVLVSVLFYFICCYILLIQMTVPLLPSLFKDVYHAQ